ncbi:MAG: AtpZ/AtpI family protein [Ignavibacteria bacterium]|nr:AtpZ/AtpI family protein [Ignavibacteria bacterium]
MSSAPEPDEPKRRSELFPGLGQTYRDFAPYLTLGFQLAAAVVAFFLVGWWLDTRFETAPLFELIGVVLGTIGGMTKFFRSVSKLTKEKKS